MEEEQDRVVSLPAEAGPAEERMLRVDLVREIVARKQRGEGVKRIARELAVDRDGEALAGARQLATAAKPATAPADRSFRRVHRAAGGGSRLERCGAASGAGGPGLHRNLPAGAALSKAAPREAEVVGVGDGSRPSRASRHRSITASSGPGSGSSRRRCICSFSPWDIRGACSRAGITTKGWRHCSTGTSARCATSAGSPLPVSTIIRAPWCWAAARTRCCGTRCSRTSPATTASPRAPANRAARAPRARSRAG